VVQIGRPVLDTPVFLRIYWPRLQIDSKRYDMKDGKSAITFPLSEHVSLPGTEDTTEAIGEEHPTTTSGEGPAVFQGEMTRHGGPFGAY
jgi:hypothetical protein